ncbi:protein NipSnap homolog 1-like [Dendronephthya gigantea]|uniref:protein NipSnap homolog 1-like n=1 Tax=Dendronephthya gigantea TaxID=151771 RepID=UPI00106ACC5C|nr:protein NipSnap homolog 1-like [Dendronephthya gigantea]
MIKAGEYNKMAYHRMVPNIFFKNHTFFPRLVSALTKNRINTRALSNEKGFWSSIVAGGAESRSEAHSKILANNILYEFQFHHLKPERVGDYSNLVASELPRISEDPDFPGTLLGSWTTLYGPLDSAVHLWVYKAGFEDVTKAKHYLHTNEKFVKFAEERAPMLHKRYNQLICGFDFWGEPQLRDTKNLYELRTYHLKPGCLIEWKNNWMNAIVHRQQMNEDVGGFFTQIGELYVVHHLWAYSNLTVRKQTREAAWNSPNWADCVANTVPLVRKMESRIMLPTSFSPLT